MVTPPRPRRNAALVWAAARRIEQKGHPTPPLGYRWWRGSTFHSKPDRGGGDRTSSEDYFAPEPASGTRPGGHLITSLQEPMLCRCRRLRDQTSLWRGTPRSMDRAGRVSRGWWSPFLPDVTVPLCLGDSFHLRRTSSAAHFAPSCPLGFTALGHLPSLPGEVETGGDMAQSGCGLLGSGRLGVLICTKKAKGRWGRKGNLRIHAEPLPMSDTRLDRSGTLWVSGDKVEDGWGFTVRAAPEAAGVRQGGLTIGSTL